MVSFLVFLLTLAQLTLIALSYMQQWPDLFALVTVHMSPVMVFFGGLQSLVNFTGEFSFFFFPALGYSIIKYILLAISLRNEELGLFNVGALVMEIIYVAGSSLYVVYYSYL